MVSLVKSLLVVTLAVGAAPGAFAAPGEPLGEFLWKNRVLLVSAPAVADPRLREQRRIFAGMRGAARERDLVLVEAVGNGARAVAIRQRFGLPSDRFAAVLVGKDGGGKRMSQAPLGAAELVPIIDAMPMRRDEVKRR